jgi:hypothetical protein
MASCGHGKQGGKPVFAIGRLVQERSGQKERGHEFDRDRCGTNGYQRVHGYSECITGLSRGPANGIAAGFRIVWPQRRATASSGWVDPAPIAWICNCPDHTQEIGCWVSRRGDAG